MVLGVRCTVTCAFIIDFTIFNFAHHEFSWPVDFVVLHLPLSKLATICTLAGDEVSSDPFLGGPTLGHGVTLLKRVSRLKQVSRRLDLPFGAIESNP
jgi:hypothetical protein